MNYDQKRAETENLRDLDRVIGYLGATRSVDEAIRFAENSRAPARVVTMLMKVRSDGSKR